ncbi:2701_t:CDS:2 [Funneliformis caledonium]|uniref:2701_t:CDS:1 n=1 Tax=Funneliformis caledonium TaxID=1117310 RepID=A0A9N9E8Q0_9GLOM|nr:2701_t:CDS:2 [Funneliformis caledonium]
MRLQSLNSLILAISFLTFSSAQNNLYITPFITSSTSKFGRRFEGTSVNVNGDMFATNFDAKIFDIDSIIPSQSRIDTKLVEYISRRKILPRIPSKGGRLWFCGGKNGKVIEHLTFGRTNDGTHMIDIDGMRTDIDGNLYVTRHDGSHVTVLCPLGKQLIQNPTILIFVVKMVKLYSWYERLRRNHSK